MKDKITKMLSDALLHIMELCQLVAVSGRYFSLLMCVLLVHKTVHVAKWRYILLPQLSSVLKGLMCWLCEC